MQLPSRSLVLASCFLVVFADRQSPLAFGPREGSEVVKEFETRLSLGLDDLTMEVNGEDIDPAMFLGGLDLDSVTADLALSMGFHDSYVKLGDGRPLELLRTFDSGTFSAETGVNDEDVEDEYELVGHAVRFVWKPETSVYECAFEGEPGEESHLEYLAEDMDLRGFLPAGEVEAGDSWEIAWSAHPSLVVPGYDFSSFDPADLEPDDGDMPVEFVKELIDGLARGFADASATCTFEGLREVDGVQLAVVSIASEIEATVDLLSAFDHLPEEVRAQASFERFDLDVGIELTGELVWDVAAGHFRSFELSGPVTGSLALEATAKQESMEFGAYASAEFSGEISRTATAE